MLPLPLLAAAALALPPTRIAVTGATGRLGRQAVRTLLEQGYAVRVLLRRTPSPRDPPSLAPSAPPSAVAAWLAAAPEVEVVHGDVTDPACLVTLLDGCDACLALHGARRMRRLRDLWADPTAEAAHSAQVNWRAVAHLLAAARASGRCRRIVRVTGKGESPWSVPSILINALGSMAKAYNYEGEQLLRAAKGEVEYTIIRPGVMAAADAPPPKSLALADDGGELRVSAIPYGAVARLCVDVLRTPGAACATLTAMTVPSGEGEDSWAPLLAKVRPDRRQFRADLLQEHQRAVRVAAVVGGAVLALLLAAVGALIARLVGA
ncbi:hypothetical protein AB1Y20_008728 [Prymnesium parvum]|uniref:NAD(P)-binding domain-containing protein n=1 Tax=Prymnesium parvum TaxID=97485 RepID=A0AB34IR53_PRYPA